MDKKKASGHLAKIMVVNCIRNTFLEDLHSGRSPVSKIGDFSDVKVVFPDGEIPWNEISRINQLEMKKLMTEFVNNIYTFLLNQSDEHFLEAMGRMYPHKWDKPKINQSFVKAADLIGQTKD